MKTILVDAADTFTKDVNGTYVIDQELYALLETFPNRKVIVTNADDEQQATYGLVNLPYELFTLKHNPDKPDPHYFKTLLEQYGYTSADVVYFEHNPLAVESAQSVGIISYHFDHETRDLEALRQFLVGAL
jgi:HAD superfamily hydrolase (TIGR01509 family)